MKVAHFGTFDVLNYGDLLFPIVARHYLKEPDYSFEWISPKGGPPVCVDAVPTSGVLDLEWSEFNFDLALIGGGNIINTEATRLASYAEPPGLSTVAYPALWLAACIRAAECGASIAWNAPGVSRANWSPNAQIALRGCLKMSDLRAFREPEFICELTKKWACPIRVVPDTVVTLPKVWPKASLEAVTQDVRRRHSLTGRYFVVHLKQRNLKRNEDRKNVARLIEQLAQSTGWVPVLVPIGRCHGDAEFLSTLALDLNVTAVVIDEVTGLRETTALLTNAEYVAAASLHCALVAAAYDVPVRVLETQGLPKYRAYFEGHLGMRRTVAASAEAAFALSALEEASEERGSMRVAVAAAIEHVEKHFGQIRELSPNPAKTAQRQEALRKMRRQLKRAAPLAAYMPMGSLL